MGAKLGALGLAFPLIGGRWGAYIGFAPIYFADLFVILGAAATMLRPADYPRARFPRTYWVFWTATAAFLIIALLRGHGDLVTRIRDLIPWFYPLLLPAAVQWALVTGYQRILKYLTVTLLAHAVWAIPALFGALPSVDLGLTVLGQSLFEGRPDIDVPLVAAAVVLAIHRWGMRLPTTAFAFAAASAAAAQTSRAALVGSAIAIGIFARVRGHLSGTQGLVRLLGAVVVVTLAVFVLLPAIAARQADRFDTGALARAGLYGSARAEASGAGTANARFQAWSILLRDYAEDGYPPLGAGAGAEIIINTGTVRYFGGDEDTRAPHNWWLHALIRTGYVGTLLWIGLLVSGSRPLARRGPRSDADGFLTALGALLAAAVLLTGTLGVVIETPFGLHVLLIGTALFGLPAQRG